MSSVALPRPGATIPVERLIIAGGTAIGSLVMGAVAHRLISAGHLFPANVNPWLVLHLGAVIPALPLGAYVLVRRKGDRLHRQLGRLWVLLMMITALSSFGLRSSGHLSWIHILSVVTMVLIPRSIMFAIRGDIRRHRFGMRRAYLALVIAGAFTFLPGRLMAMWLIG